LKGTIGYVKVIYKSGESGKMGQSLREREGLRKEHWYVADQSVYKSGLRIRAKGQRQEERKEFRERQFYWARPIGLQVIRCTIE